MKYSLNLVLHDQSFPRIPIKFVLFSMFPFNSFDFLFSDQYQPIFIPFRRRPECFATMTKLILIQKSNDILSKY